MPASSSACHQCPNRCSRCSLTISTEPQRDCLYRYELESVQFPRFTFILCIGQALFGSLITIIAVICLVQGLTSIRTEDVPMNCIDCSGIWMGICHVSWALVGICAFQARIEGRKAYQTRSYLICGFISISYDVVLVIISFVWAAIFFGKAENGMAAIDLVIALLAIGHGCMTCFACYGILQKAPKRQFCSCRNRLPSYQQFQRQSEDYLTMETFHTAHPTSPGPTAATTHSLHRHSLSFPSSLLLPPQSTMASNPATTIHCDNCSAHHHAYRRPKDCIDQVYDFTFYDPPGRLFKLALIETVLGMVILGLGAGCSIHGIVSARNDGIIDCIDFSGCWMGLCHCVFGFISTCLLMSRPRNKHGAVKFVIVAGLMSVIFDCVLALIMIVWTTLFFIKGRYDLFAINIALLVAALLHGVLTVLTLVTICRTGPKRNVTRTASVSPLPPPSYQQSIARIFTVEPPPTYEMAVAQKNAQHQ
uniref:Uncharacterized protein n=1 Tax=Plectus sambesii TaxID=2011161 RepID=A0A914UJP5_9BILA